MMNGADGTKSVLRTGHRNRRCRRRYATTPDLDGRRAVAKKTSSRAWRFPKTQFSLSRCRITRANRSGDLLSRSPVHGGARDGVNYEGGAATRRGKTLTRLDAFWYRPTGQLYRRVPRPRVAIGSEKPGNRLGFHISQT